MKKMRRAIALLLVLVMLCSLSVTAFAEVSQDAKDDSTYVHYDSMFSIGDSNACGYGLPGYYGGRDSGKEAWSDGEYINGVMGSFPQLVQAALQEDGGVERANHTCLTYPAERSKDALYFLKGDVDMTGDTFFNDIAYNTWFQVIHRDSGVAEPSIDKEVGDYFVNSLKYEEGDKKLVLIYSGVSDVFFASACNAAFDLLAGGSDSVDMTKVLTDMVSEMFKNYQSFLVHVPKLIERVQELNPEADVVLVGTYNPLKNLRISADSELPVFEATAAITGMMNQSYKQWAKSYGCKYVDITNVETATLEEGLSVSTILESLNFDTIEHVYHATPEGYKYIARQILEVLKVEKDPVTKTIKVDLGSDKKITSVSVGTARINNYTYENSVLTIPYYSSNAKLLTVTAKDSNGRTSVYVYHLNWGTNGYTAYSMYATRDIAQTAKNIFKKLLNVNTLLQSAIKSAFSTVKGK